jgi:DNA-binding CsgD family transcriptional regulator
MRTGHGLSLDGAADLARSFTATPAPARRLTLPADSARSQSGEHGLTARELEILRLVAAGCSNADIAERLFISPRTVSTHITNLLNKLAVENRAAAVSYAYQHGLVQPTAE